LCYSIQELFYCLTLRTLVHNSFLLESPHVFMSLSDRSSYNGVHVSTIFNSNAFDYCFTNENDFQSYKAYSKPCFEVLVGKNIQFRIMEEDTIVIKSWIDNGKLAKVMLGWILHCLDLIVNLIFISKLWDSGIITQFTKDWMNLYDVNGTLFLTGMYIRRMYYLSRNGLGDTTVMEVKSRVMAVVIDIWHRRLWYIGKRIIKILAQQ